MPVRETIISENVRWIDLLDPTEKEMETLSKDFKLNPYIVRDSLEPMHLPKFDVVDDVNFLIIRFYVAQQDNKAATIQELTNKIAVFYTDKFLLTVHKFEVPFLDKIYTPTISSAKYSTTEDVVIKILWNALETFDDPAEKLSEQVDQYENNLMIGKTNPSHMQALYYIKRKASIAHRVLMLMQEPINHIDMPKDNQGMQDVYDQHLKMQTLFTQILDDIHNLMNLYMSFSSQRTNDVMKVLTIFSAFFLPLTFIVGVYGMNFHYMPELSKKWGYPAVILLMVIVTIIIYAWFKKKRWL
jgi:magnesium transporter